jgi:hypothetical protein
MSRTHRNAPVGALVVLALATASHRVAAQDTSSAGQAPQDTSAYTGGVSQDTTDTTLRTGVEQIDTTARPGQGAGMGDTTTDTSAVPRAQPNATQPGFTDSTRAGQEESPEPSAQPGASSDST